MRSKPKTFAKRETVDDKAVNSDVTITEKQVGIWKVKTAHTTFLGAEELKDDLRTAPALFWRLAKDIFNVSPRLVVLWLLYQAWVSVSGSISLVLSNNLLKSIEKALSAETHDESAMLKALCQRVFFSILTSCIPWYGYQLSEKLEKMVSLHFELILMKADFGVDLATSKGYDSKPETSASQVWNTLDQLTNFVRILLSLFSDVAVIVSISSSQTALSYVVLSLAHPAAAHFFRTRLTKVYLAFSNHEDFHHLQNLRNFTDGGFRPDIISGGLGAWILAQYEAVQERLQGVYTGDLESYMESKRIFPTSSAIFSVIGDLPLIYCALNAYYSPQTLSIVSLAILQQSSERLRFSINRLINSSRRFRMNVDKLRALYKPDLPSSMLTGDKKYPSDEKASAGMSFELRNLTFSYPGAQDRKALDNVSLRIKRGDLVVVVGANGSGKSTLIRILSRLYEPTSGELLIDDLLASEYSVDDLHRSTTLLSQDNLMYPLALRLNIGLGYPGNEHDQEMVDDAARQGGAAEFIAKLGDGMDTRLDPGIICHPVGLRGKKDHPLYQEMQRLVKKTEVSGGEKQRIAASRAFMRFKTGDVNFVAVDEPSSALDADGELKLFENLIAVRQGKTMVFVTHRFGHLTKYADQIICMKDGSIAEHGSHEELMQLNGEYANLYNIQAGAFAG